MTGQPTAGTVIGGGAEIIGGFARLQRSARRCLALGVIPLALSVLWWPNSARAESLADGARARVESLLDEGVKLLAEKEVTSQNFVDGFHRLFREYFAVRSIGKWTLGRHWNRATPEQRREYLRLFEDFVVLAEVKRFRKYTGGRVNVIRAAVNTENAATVYTEAVREQDNTRININWRVGRQGDVYKITDVVVEGTSMSQTMRSDFGATIRKRGNSVAGLIDDLRDKVSALEAEVNREG